MCPQNIVHRDVGEDNAAAKDSYVELADRYRRLAEEGSEVASQVNELVQALPSAL